MTINENGRNGETEGEGKAPVVALFPLKAIGHLQMFLPIVKELLERKAEVHMFLDDMSDSKDSKGEQVIQALVNLGVKRHSFISLLNSKYNDWFDLLLSEYFPKLLEKNLSVNHDILRILGMSSINYELIPILMEELKGSKPDCILFDTMNACGGVLGKVLNVPAIGYVSYPGPGCMDQEEEYYDALHEENVQECMREICMPVLDKYNVDMMKETNGSPGPLLYSDYINIVTTLEELAQTQSKIHEKKLHTFQYIGPTVDENIRLNATSTPKVKEEKESSGISASAAPGSHKELHPFLDLTGDLPWKAITDAKLEGKKVICSSFGTVITSFSWASHEPEDADDADKTSNEKLEEGKKRDLIGGAKTGKELCHKLWKDLFEAFGEDPNVLFITSVGKQSDALEGEGLDVPSNFIIRQEIPQLKVLRQVDVFITHGGWNSLQESLYYGVPMLVLPGLGDQMRNARLVNDIGAGIGIQEPYLNTSVDILKSSLNQLLHEEHFKSKAEAIGKKLSNANGAKRAADIVLEAATSQFA